MFPASSRLRFAVAFVASAIVASCATTTWAQIDFSLNVFYTSPGNANSGGTWELIAKSAPGPASFGIAAITANLANINSESVALEAPRAKVNSGVNAGFQLLGNSPHAAAPPTPAYREIIVGQVPIFPLPSSGDQSLFYGVGNLLNGAPNYPAKPPGSNSIGPAFTTLTGPQDIAWAATPDAFGDANWNIAARLLSGTFAEGVTPAFVAGSGGNVYTALPAAANGIGPTAVASAITTIVRTNFVAIQSADYNHDGIVDAADYAVWRKTEGQTVAPPGAGADGNHDGTVNAADYDLWRSHFGNPMGSGSGGGLSDGTVPEPTTGFLLTIGAVLISACRRSRS